jgi:signal transduction histidine kinase
MAPAVPFALVGVIQLVAVAGWLALAGGACFPGVRGRGSTVFVGGALLLAAADVLTVLRFGQAGSTLVALLRAGGFALVGVGLAGGVLQRVGGRGTGGGGAGGSDGLADAGRRGRAPGGQPVAGVVVPLGAAAAPAAAAGAAGVLAVLGAVAGAAVGSRWRRDLPLAGLLVATMAAAAAAAWFSVWAARSGVAADAELGLRALFAAGACAVCVRLARRSLLARVVIAILAGVVAMAAAAVGIVGSSVAGAITRQQEAATRQAARGQVAAVAAAETDALRRAELVTACTGAGAAGCSSLFDTFAVEPHFFAAVVRPHGRLSRVAGSRLGLLGAAQLARAGLVRQAFHRGAVCGSGLLVLQTSPPELTAVGVAPDSRSGCGTASLTGTPFAGVFGVGYTNGQAATIAGQIAYGVTFLGDGQVLASSLRGRARGAVADAYRRLGAAPLPAGGVTVDAGGSGPTVSFLPLSASAGTGGQTAVLAVSLSAGRLLNAERSALIGLFLTAVAVLVVVAGFGLVLGRQIVGPVRRLTDAARRIRSGDLDVTAATGAADEVGVLSRSFDAMTAALRRRSEELRAAADIETSLRLRLQTVFDAMQDGLLATDATGRVTSVNPAAEQLLDRPGEEVLGAELTSVLAVHDGGGRRWVPRAGSQADGTLLRASGTLAVRVAATALGVPGGGGASGAAGAASGAAGAASGAGEDGGADGAGGGDGAGLLVVVRDSTRDREVERLKTEFLSNVSHELRTPLTPIRGYAELLARRRFPPAKVAEYLAEIHGSSLRMQRVVDLLVDVASLEAGRVAPHRQPTAVADLVDGCLRRWRNRWPERAEDLRRKLAAGLPAVDVDPEWIGKACDEFADNAVKYTPPGTPIVVFAVPVGTDRVRLGVRDAGPGIPAAALPGLLGDFSQVDASETRAVGGLGLGLGFVRRLGEAFSLPLHAESTVGRGSEFALDLPVAGASPGTGPARSRRPATVRRLVGR